MIPVATGVRVWIATGHTDMRRGMRGLALQVQEGLGRDPFAGDVYVFRGTRSKAGDRRPPDRVKSADGNAENSTATGQFMIRLTPWMPIPPPCRTISRR